MVGGSDHLLGRQESSDRVVHQVQLQPRPGLSIPEIVQLDETPDAAIKHSTASLHVDVFRRIARKRRHHMHLTNCSRGREG